MKHCITTIAMALLLGAGCVATDRTSQAWPDAPDDAVGLIRQLLPKIDFSDPIPADKFLRTLGLLEWSNSLEYTPGARHMSTAWRLNSTTVLEAHFNDWSQGYLGATLLSNGDVVARNVNPDWVLVRNAHKEHTAPNKTPEHISEGRVRPSENAQR